MNKNRTIKKRMRAPRATDEDDGGLAPKNVFYETCAMHPLILQDFA